MKKPIEWTEAHRREAGLALLRIATTTADPGRLVRVRVTRIRRAP